MKVLVRSILAVGVICLSATCDLARSYRLGYVDSQGRDWSLGISVGGYTPAPASQGFSASK